MNEEPDTLDDGEKEDPDTLDDGVKEDSDSIFTQDDGRVICDESGFGSGVVIGGENSDDRKRKWLEYRSQMEKLLKGPQWQTDIMEPLTKVFQYLEDKANRIESRCSDLNSSVENSKVRIDSLQIRVEREEHKVENVSKATATLDTRIGVLGTQVHDLEKSCASKVDEVETLYHNKLSLEAPAEYWKSLSEKLLRRGVLYLSFSLVISVLYGCYLFHILFHSEELQFFKEFALNSATIRGSILFVVVSSIVIFFINLFARLSMSCYHLSRDYQERRQLTYVYLSLLNGQKTAHVSEAQNIILQAIFSRSETGLLKGDHSPSMPMPSSEIVDMALRATKGITR